MNSIVECDYCSSMLEEGEDLHPIYIGEIPQPKTTRHSEHTVKATERETVAYSETSGSGGMQVLGRPVDEIFAILSAIENCEVLELNTFGRIMTPESFSSDYPLDSRTPTTFDSVENDDFLAAEILVTPEREKIEPDMRVCKYCKEELQND